jgi:subtilase family serine protease
MRFANRALAAAVRAATLLLSLASAQAAAGAVLRGHVPEAVATSQALGPVDRSTTMSVAVGLPLRNQAELENLLKDLVDPASPGFRQYLTPAQFADRFGPSQDDYQSLADFFEASGLKVTGTHPNRMILDVTGNVTDVEKTFHVSLNRYRHKTRGVFFAPDREPSIDAGVTILDVTGLDNYMVPRPMDLKTLPLAQAMPLTTGSGPAGLFVGNDFRTAYAPGVTLNGAGQSVGLFELDGFYASDVTANFKQAGLPAVPVRTVLLDGFSGNPGSGNVEVILDIMMAAYMAPGATSIIVYEGTNWNDVLNRMATDNAASQLSSSWCFSPTNATTEQIFNPTFAHRLKFPVKPAEGGV